MYFRIIEDLISRGRGARNDTRHPDARALHVLRVPDVRSTVARCAVVNIRGAHDKRGTWAAMPAHYAMPHHRSSSKHASPDNSKCPGRDNNNTRNRHLCPVRCRRRPRSRRIERLRCPVRRRLRIAADIVFGLSSYIHSRCHRLTRTATSDDVLYSRDGHCPRV